MTTTSTSLANWIQSNMDTDNAERWYPLTFRVDSVIRNAQNIAQSPWSNNPTQAFQSVTRALDWTITELRRYHKGKGGLQFVPYLGGNEAVGIRSHIHAVVRVPDGQEVTTFIKRIESLWKRNLAKTLKAEVKSSVWVDKKSLQNASSFSHYSSRSEGVDSVRGMDKIHLGRSFFLEPLAT